MKAIISAACVAFLLSGCATVNAVKLVTDKHGRLVDVSLKSSSGNASYDGYLKRLAIDKFHNRVPRPASNKTYVQPIIIEYNKLEDYFGGGPRMPN
ncbi:TonB C-terminal domain-containing protein [Rhizobium sp. BT03]|uniref:TonB C-terminal domain-containing protein n=1 Tax=Rhizobium sp. BT03 TaxID=3045156 RepID=UPI0024B3D40E|nr:TonB C-terminal domain-containing protein [Rhizobium sp. BT03]WHO74717.1 TonB C-terminal domain-containing protein [Rhizobium sp. BT03]